MNHFVYLYRDQTGKPRYVGYGESSQRALSHMTQTHNLALETLLQNENLKLEISGPFHNKQTALAVETALISALVPDANVARGETTHRFRPIGVPSQFAERIALPPLSRDELLSRLEPYHSPSFLCVLIQNVDFNDGEGGIRRGYEPANPPSDAEISERVKRWWSLRPKLQKWSGQPMESPAILLGIHGKPGAQFIIASLLTDRGNWQAAPVSSDNSSRFEVPILETPHLDAAELRGRRIAGEAGLRFNLGGLVLFP
jgi:predicted GIY-YIG superfamily endonuclease